MKTYTLDDLRKLCDTFDPCIALSENDDVDERLVTDIIGDFLSHIAKQGMVEEALELFKINASRFLDGDMDIDIFIMALYQAFEAGARLDQVEATMDLVRTTTTKGQ